VRPLERAWIHVDAESLQLLEIRPPLAQLIGFLLLFDLLFVSHH
jgi:hypothetical protein